MRKILLLTLILFLSVCMNTYSEETEKEKAWKNDDPKYLNYIKDINEKDPLKKQTHLHWAATERKYNIANALIKKGADVNVKDYIDEIPLHRASAMITNNDKELNIKYYNIAKLLIEHGAKVNAKGGRKATSPDNIFKIGGKLNLTPLHLAANAGNFEIVKLLVEHGADVNAKDYESNTPLHKAVRNGNIDVVNLLLEHGANINVRDNWYGYTPLHCAIGSKFENIVKLLIEKGANLTIKAKNGLTPLQHAIDLGERNRKIIIEFLKQAEEEQLNVNKK